MGTRGLTMVISEAKTKVAQYGQWDHYPEGQGLVVLEFLKKTDLKKFKEKLNKVRFTTKKVEEEMQNFLESIGSKDGWVTSEQSSQFDAKWPYVSRDHGADILNLIMQNDEKIMWLTDSTNFAGDSLFCEWAYVIDLDKRRLEVYRGFNKSPIKKTERFAKIKNKDAEKYTPIRLLKSYSFKSLPTPKQFTKELNKLSDKE
jgi:hypothetical protein